MIRPRWFFAGLSPLRGGCRPAHLGPKRRERNELGRDVERQLDDGFGFYHRGHGVRRYPDAEGLLDSVRLLGRRHVHGQEAVSGCAASMPSTSSWAWIFGGTWASSDGAGRAVARSSAERTMEAFLSSWMAGGLRWLWANSVTCRWNSGLVAQDVPRRSKPLLHPRLITLQIPVAILKRYSGSGSCRGQPHNAMPQLSISTRPAEEIRGSTCVRSITPMHHAARQARFGTGSSWALRPRRVESCWSGKSGAGVDVEVVPQQIQIRRGHHRGPRYQPVSRPDHEALSEEIRHVPP